MMGIIKIHSKAAPISQKVASTLRLTVISRFPAPQSSYAVTVLNVEILTLTKSFSKDLQLPSAQVERQQNKAISISRLPVGDQLLLIQQLFRLIGDSR